MLRADRPVVVAHSLPGSLTARVAVAHGDILDRLVLISAPALARWRPSPAFVATATRFNLRPSQRTLDRFNRWAYADPDRLRQQGRTRQAAVERYALARASAPEARRTIRQLLAAGRVRVPDSELRRIEVPTTLVWGREDRMAPLRIAHEASRALGWPVAVVESAGHVPHVEQPDALLAALARATA